MRYFLKLSYNGENYHGWQIQPNAITVQETIEVALSTLLNSKTSIVGAGRTDAGVHAIQMYAHFDTIESFIASDLVFKLNSFLPEDISIADVFQVKPEAHARFDAVSRTYIYRIAVSKNVFNAKQTYYIKHNLNLDAMNAAASILLQYKDFQCFSKSNTDVKTYHCDVKYAQWNRREDELCFTIKADRFLRNMVRAVVGTMINIGLNKLTSEDMHKIIASKNRSEAGYSVPAKALFLTDIEYPNSILL